MGDITTYHPDIQRILEDTNNVGILILDISRENVLFLNNYFYELTGIYSQYVIKNIFKYISSKKKFKIHNDIKIEEKIKFGYSVYGVKKKKNIAIILISDISSKQIFLDSKSKKSYYKKLSKYSSEIAHEVGNPLTSVIMTLQVLAKNLNTWDLNQKGVYIDTTIKELKRLSNFMNRIRDLSKDFELEMKNMDLKEVINRVIIQNKARLDKNNINIINKVGKNLHVHVDEEALYQIIFNLIQNSIDILPKESTIRFKIIEVDDFFVILEYSNNGPPIPEEILEKIFLPFFSTKEGGSGIGLDLSLKLMTNMGGTIKVENKSRNRGVKFTLFIPVAEENGSNGIDEGN